jgi:branched-chain amino acid transport system permease protein
MSSIISPLRISSHVPSRRALVIFSILAAIVAMLPVVIDNYYMRLMTTVMMYCVLAWSWNFIGGFVGYPSFGIAAFFGLGAYAGAILLSSKIIPFWLSPVVGAAVCFVTAVIVGLPILRLRGHYFAVASFGIAEVFREIAMSWTDLTGGGMGINLPSQKPLFGTDAMTFYYMMFILAGVTFLTTLMVARSRLGVAFRCIRQNEAAANMIGVDATRSKIIAFAFASAFPGAAGAIYASWVGYIDATDAFDILISIKAPVMVLLGGVGTVFGPAVGAVVYLVFEELVTRNFLQFHAGLLGIIVVVIILFLPTGVLSLVRQRKEKMS